LVALVVLQLCACGEEGIRPGDNLLKNGSFEDVNDGLPERWGITNFRGLQDMEAATYGVTDSIAYDGKQSFFFKAGPVTRRFYTLVQEVKVTGAKRVRIRGAILSKDCDETDGQYPQANFALTFYGPNRERFEGTRFADVRTDPSYGSTDGWTRVERIYKLPLGTAIVAVHCVLGMRGEIWFDDVSLDVPEELPWQSIEGTDFTHYWLDKPYPEGSAEFQQQLLERYAARLAIPSESRSRISYYFYPDTTLYRTTLGVKRGRVYVDYRRRTIHSINPVDEHEIVHLLTDPYGVLPKILSEGTAYYFMDDFKSQRVQPLAQELLLSGELVPLRQLLVPTGLSRGDPSKLVPTAASFAGYLIEVGGPVKFLELHTQTTVDMGYAGFADAFESVYGKTLERTENAWRRVLAKADFSEPQESEADSEE